MLKQRSSKITCKGFLHQPGGWSAVNYLDLLVLFTFYTSPLPDDKNFLKKFLGMGPNSEMIIRFYRSVEVHLPADPANPESEAKVLSQAGQVSAVSLNPL